MCEQSHSAATRGFGGDRAQPRVLADLVVLRADPLADIRNTREIVFVLKRGRVVEAGR